MTFVLGSPGVSAASRARNIVAVLWDPGSEISGSMGQPLSSERFDELSSATAAPNRLLLPLCEALPLSL
jgi:hypothetical protein